MKLIVIICLALLAVYRNVDGAAATCNSTECTIAKNCRCSDTVGPLTLADTPQLIVLAFVDAAENDLYLKHWSPMVEPRKNPDGDYIGATFYVPHQYTNYQIVHDLAANGFEIGVHSVTNDVSQDYWQSASQALLEHEFGDQRKIISKFANIPEELVRGSCTPQLRLAGDNSINAFASQGFSYDNSWPSHNQIYPYTLDYASTQTCDTGAICPSASHPGFWIAPIVDLHNDRGDLCATIASCFNSDKSPSASEISKWLVDQVHQIKNHTRAPLTLIIEEKLFGSVTESWNGLQSALDILEADKEVYFVSQARVIEWIQNPVPLAKFRTGAHAIETGCDAQTCKLQKDENDVRYMVSCVPCPKTYPWLNNPEGN